MNEKQRIIISLTSFPEAIPYAVESIKSILQGSLLPDKIVLYLDSQKFPDNTIPQELEILRSENSIFEVRFDPSEIRSYKKLIPALKDFPNDIIVTIDDDIYYPKNLLRSLVRLHRLLPNAIIAHRVRRIQINKPYSKWRKYKWYDFIFRRHHFDYFAMQTGVGGVLYPPKSLDENMLDPALFMELAPTNDDIWFWAAAVSKGTYVVPVPNGRNIVKEVGKPDNLALKAINLKSGDDRNREALDKILNYYPIIREKLENNK